MRVLNLSTVTQYHTLVTTKYSVILMYFQCHSYSIQQNYCKLHVHNFIVQYMIIGTMLLYNTFIYNLIVLLEIQHAFSVETWVSEWDIRGKKVLPFQSVLVTLLQQVYSLLAEEHFVARMKTGSTILGHLGCVVKTFMYTLQ